MLPLVALMTSGGNGRPKNFFDPDDIIKGLKKFLERPDDNEWCKLVFEQASSEKEPKRREIDLSWDGGILSISLHADGIFLVVTGAVRVTQGTEQPVIDDYRLEAIEVIRKLFAEPPMAPSTLVQIKFGPGELAGQIVLAGSPRKLSLASERANYL